jgi:DNA-binding GntR family transcriptional regulator
MPAPDPNPGALPERKRETRADDLRRRMRADILSGQLRPGERLQFPEMCWRYGTSVGVLREALTWLAAQGLVRTQAHQGHVVTPLSRSDLDELTAARLLIEPAVVALSVREGNVEWEARVVAAHHVLTRTARTVDDHPNRPSPEWATVHEAFHAALFSGCGNRRLISITEGLAHGAALYRISSIPYEEDRDVAAEHRGLVDAAVSRDAELAARRLHAHISNTVELLREHVEDG